MLLHVLVRVSGFTVEIARTEPRRTDFLKAMPDRMHTVRLR